MLTDEIRAFVSASRLAFLASSDEKGTPHLATGREVRIISGDRIVLENWFCHATLRNLSSNRRVAVAVAGTDTGTGYQFLGTVEAIRDTMMLDGMAPGGEFPGMPQTLVSLEIRIETVLAFCAGFHTDLPLA